MADQRDAGVKANAGAAGTLRAFFSRIGWLRAISASLLGALLLTGLYIVVVSAGLLDRSVTSRRLMDSGGFLRGFAYALPKVIVTAEVGVRLDQCLVLKADGIDYLYVSLWLGTDPIATELYRDTQGTYIIELDSVTSWFSNSRFSLDLTHKGFVREVNLATEALETPANLSAVEFRYVIRIPVFGNASRKAQCGEALVADLDRRDALRNRLDAWRKGELASPDSSLGIKGEADERPGEATDQLAQDLPTVKPDDAALATKGLSQQDLAESAFLDERFDRTVFLTLDPRPPRAPEIKDGHMDEEGLLAAGMLQSKSLTNLFGPTGPGLGSALSKAKLLLSMAPVTGSPLISQGEPPDLTEGVLYRFPQSMNVHLCIESCAPGGEQSSGKLLNSAVVDAPQLGRTIALPLLSRPFTDTGVGMIASEDDGRPLTYTVSNFPRPPSDAFLKARSSKEPLADDQRDEDAVPHREKSADK